MARIVHCVLLILIGNILAGCSRGSASTDTPPAATGASAAAKTTPVPPPGDPVARVAYDFLDAVLKGDDQRVSACLTPIAIERLIASHQRFALPGVDSTTFQIGEVRKPSETQALVQCLLRDSSKPDDVRQEEICCLVRQVEGGWRVSGIAFNPGPGRQPAIIDFEASPSEPMGMPVSQHPSAGPDAPAAPNRPSPPRTADETPLPSYR